MNIEDEILKKLDEIRTFQETYYQEWKDEVARVDQVRQSLIEKDTKRVKKATRTVRILLVLLLVFIGFVLYSIKFPMSCKTTVGVEGFSYLTDMDHDEALEWLNGNSNPSPLASNRFGEKENAVEFVEKLYAAGASAVYVVNPDRSETVLQDEGGPYADSLVVLLPDEKARRKELFDIYNTESSREGFDGIGDMGQKELFFWWD